MVLRQHTIDTPYMVGPVHCYSADFDGELVLFDTGPPTRAAKRYLIENIDLKRLRHVAITHCHIDHYGLAAWLEKETNAQIYIPYRDGLKITRHQERLQRVMGILEEFGFSHACIEASRKVIPEGKLFPPLPEKFKLIEEDFPGHLGFTYLNCAGHSQSDLVFTGDNWAITGDVLLRGIFQSPLLDVDLETGKRFYNYGAYCSTLEKLITLREKTLFPGHRKKVKGIDITVLFYIEKMFNRVERLLPMVEGESVAQLIDRCFGQVITDPFHVYLKASEIIFMQDFLHKPQLLRDALIKMGLFQEVEGQFDRIIR